MNPVVRRRCPKLRMECISGVTEKASVLTKWLDDHNIDAKSCIYVGNDVNDMGCMALVGYSVASSNAVPEIKAVADLVLHDAGGHGAVRELVDLLFVGSRMTLQRIAEDESSRAQ
jgi:YrbI family 3-deoxy-D-manno-octulosonate 8-phosphate phosphatase